MGSDIIWEQKNNSFVLKFQKFWDGFVTAPIAIGFGMMYFSVVDVPSNDLVFWLFWVVGLLGVMNIPVVVRKWLGR